MSEEPQASVDIMNFLLESNAIEDVFDADSFGRALLAWAYIMKFKKLTKEVICETHKILMRKHLPEEQRGKFRKVNVTIGGQMGLAYQLIEDSFDQWLHIANQMRTAEFPEEWAKQSHIQFERIHPFIDGNGRIGRIILNWQRQQCGKPVLIINRADRQDYYKWFKMTLE